VTILVLITGRLVQTRLAHVGVLIRFFVGTPLAIAPDRVVAVGTRVEAAEQRDWEEARMGMELRGWHRTRHSASLYEGSQDVLDQCISDVSYLMMLEAFNLMVNFNDKASFPQDCRLPSPLDVYLLFCV